MDNTRLFTAVIKALFSVSGRRTSQRFANDTINSCLKTLETRFNFLKYVYIGKTNFTNNNLEIKVNPEVNNIDPKLVGGALEALIRIVYTDLNIDAGLYFISELKETAGYEITKEIINREVDLDQIQLEQHHFFLRQEREKSVKNQSDDQVSKKKKINLIGYTWDNVASWKHEPNSQYCILYDNDGKVLDRLNLDRIIQTYVEKLSEYEEIKPNEYEKQVQIYENDYKLLELMFSQDMNIEEAAELLKTSEIKINEMIRKLARMEMIHYTDSNTVELTDNGIDYLFKKKKDS